MENKQKILIIDSGLFDTHKELIDKLRSEGYSVELGTQFINGNEFTIDNPSLEMFATGFNNKALDRASGHQNYIEKFKTPKKSRR